MVSCQAVDTTSKPRLEQSRQKSRRLQLLFTTCAGYIISQRLQDVNQKIDGLFQHDFFRFLETGKEGTVQVQHTEKNPVFQHRNYDFRPGGRIASNVADKILDVGDDDGFLGLSGGSAYPFAQGDRGARREPLERPQDQTPVLPEVKTRPTDVWEEVFEEGGHIGQVGNLGKRGIQISGKIFQHQLVVGGGIRRWFLGCEHFITGNIIN